MGRHSKGALTVKECRRLELSYLRKKKLLQKGSIVSSILSWSDGSSVEIICCYKEDERYIRLQYMSTVNGVSSTYDYKVNITSTKSNLGQGELLYFICPKIGVRCKVLYCAYDSPIYKSRQSYSKRIYYNSQICSKYDYWLTRYWDTHKKIKPLIAKSVKAHYRGSPTKLQMYIAREENRLTRYEIKKEDVYFKRMIQILSIRSL